MRGSSNKGRVRGQGKSCSGSVVVRSSVAKLQTGMGREEPGRENPLQKIKVETPSPNVPLGTSWRGRKPRERRRNAPTNDEHVRSHVLAEAPDRKTKNWLRKKNRSFAAPVAKQN